LDLLRRSERGTGTSDAFSKKVDKVVELTRAWDTSNVENVFVAGKLMKWHGKLVGVDLNGVRRTIEKSRDAVLARAGYSSDRFGTCCVTCREVIEMATIAGARAAHLDHKIGTLSPGKEADIIMLATDRINVFPLNNVPGTIVTLMVSGRGRTASDPLNPSERRQILLSGERTLVDEGALQGEGGAHDREHIRGHVALNIDAKARLNAVIECRLKRRHAVPHLHLDGGRDRNLAAGVSDHLPLGLVELCAMNVFIVRTHQPGLADRFEIAGPVSDDMTDDRHAGLPGERPIVRVGSRVQLQSQQLIGR
jgi:hypothetical protein